MKRTQTYLSISSSATLLGMGLALSLTLSACASHVVYTTGHTGINNAPLAYSKMGNGGPTIVFQSGLGDGKDSWSPIASSLARGSQVFAYDRPGYGDSKESAAPRDPCSIATELRAALHQAGVRPPFLLVGHSIGGIYQYAFARMYARRCVGHGLNRPYTSTPLGNHTSTITYTHCDHEDGTLGWFLCDRTPRI